MKIIQTLVIVLLIVFGSGTYTYSSEGHEATALPLHKFRIDTAEAKLAIIPETFVEGKVPEIELTLADAMSGSPVLNAEIYIFIQDAVQTSDHRGHAMSSSTGRGKSGEGGLDFGDSLPVEASYDLSFFTKFESTQKAGVYAAVYPLLQKGDYRFTIAVKSLGGKKFGDPLIFGSTLSYQKASAVQIYRIWAVMAVITFSGLIGILIIALRKAAHLNEGKKLNLLDIPWVKKFFKSSWFQPVFQIPVLLSFLIIIAAGLFDIQQGDRNIATLLMWTIWWAAIIFTFVLVGRIWCMMCPFGAVQDWIGRLFSLNKNFPKPVRNIWLSSFIFFGLTWWDSFSGIVNKPALTSYLLIGFFIIAVTMATIFKGRSFCRYVCPIGGLIGLYSMFSPIELRNRCLDTCRKHKVKECVKRTENSYPCPMFETPMTLDRNNYCNFCSECIKACSQDNIVIRFRSFAKDLWISAKGYMDEAYLAMVLVGLTIVVTGEMVEPWHKWMDVTGKVIPFSLLGITTHAGMEKTTFLIVMTIGSLFVPLLLLAGTALVVKKTAGTESPLTFKQTFVQFAYMFIPVGLSMHLAHNISHLFKEGPGVVPAMQRVFNTYTGLSLGEPDWNITPLMGAESIFWLQMLTLMILNIFSLYAGYRIAVKYYGSRALKAFTPMTVLAILFMVINIFILGQPMAPRHTH